MGNGKKIIFCSGDTSASHTTLSWAYLTQRYADLENDTLTVLRVAMPSDRSSRPKEEGYLLPNDPKAPKDAEKGETYEVWNEGEGPWTLDQLDEYGFDFLAPSVKQGIEDLFPYAKMLVLKPRSDVKEKKAAKPKDIILEYVNSLGDLKPDVVLVGAQNTPAVKKSSHIGKTATALVDSAPCAVMLVRDAPAIVDKESDMIVPFPSGRRNVTILAEGADISHRMTKYACRHLIWTSDHVTLAWAPKGEASKEGRMNKQAEFEGCQKVLKKHLSSMESQFTDLRLDLEAKQSISDALVNHVNNSERGSLDFVVTSHQVGSSAKQLKQSHKSTYAIASAIQVPVLVVRQNLAKEHPVKDLMADESKANSSSGSPRDSNMASP